jgi:hydrogenase maturation protein HypF
VALAAPATAQRRRYRVLGVVQGVGFRPWVHALAVERSLGGFVRNDGDAVVIEAEGDVAALDDLGATLARDAPSLAQVHAVAWEPVAPAGDRRFAVAPSRDGGAALVPADAATCDDCLRELLDPGDRRFRHPFITCTACGPRFTVTTGSPYDRHRTTMAPFAVCDACRAEYGDPADRRFHAETIACHDCGPRLSMQLEEAVGLLRDGGVLAVKGLGGWHLACLAGDDAAVSRLRGRKLREDKPFAVMCLDPAGLAVLDPEDARVLAGSERPIVLVRRAPGAAVADAVAPGSPWLGLMLPYTPLHHLLLRDVGEPLVMTSGNRSDEPIAVGDGEARERLGGIADAFLGHDRAIHRRCEDSVVRGGAVLRRSRGHVPRALPLPVGAPAPIVAAGAELKSTFCLVRGHEAFPSPHLGDLHTAEALRAFEADLALYRDMLGVRPEVVAHDLHPGYLSTRWALEQDAAHVAVQHHHAHAAACLAEHGELGPALAVVLDGTGYGPDGTLWGGEVLRCDLAGFERVAHLAPVALPGGEAAIRQPWRSAAAYLEAAERPVPFERWRLVRQSLAVNAPLASGAGRLLDAVAALLGLRHEISYEGQAAIELEQLAGSTPAAPYACRRDGPVIHGADLVAAAHDDLAAGLPASQIAAAVHEGLAAAFAAACLDDGGARTVALSGGCLQNVRLAAGLRHRLEAGGMRVLTHRMVPPNDGGISYGQAAAAAARMG